MSGFLPLALAFLAALGDDKPGAPGVTTPSDPAFVATLIDGTTESGQIRRLGLDPGVTLVGGDGAEHAIPTARLVKLAREGSSPPAKVEGGGVVVFPDGDRLAHCRIGTAGEVTLDVHSSPLENLAIPIDAILGLILEAPAESDAADALVARVRAEPRTSELLWLGNGDRLPGLLAGLDEGRPPGSSTAGRPKSTTAPGRWASPGSRGESAPPWPSGRGGPRPSPAWGGGPRCSRGWRGGPPASRPPRGSPPP